MPRFAVAAVAAFAMASLPAAADAKRMSPQQKLEKILKGRVSGPPSNCIYLPSIRSTEVIEDTAIVYDAGDVLWVNQPRHGANFLGHDDVLVTETHNSSLCSIDLVRLHDRSSLIRTGSISLGKFVPYRKVAAGN